MSLETRFYEIRTYEQPAETAWYQKPSTYVIPGLGVLAAFTIALAVRKYQKRKEEARNDQELREKMTRRWKRRPPHER